MNTSYKIIPVKKTRQPEWKPLINKPSPIPPSRAYEIRFADARRSQLPVRHYRKEKIPSRPQHVIVPRMQRRIPPPEKPQPRKPRSWTIYMARDKPLRPKPVLSQRVPISVRTPVVRRRGNNRSKSNMVRKPSKNASKIGVSRTLQARENGWFKYW